MPAGFSTKALIVGVAVFAAAAAATIGARAGVCPDSSSIWVRFALSGLILGFMYALIALGYSLVYGVLQLLNFAHSEVFMIGSFAGLYALSGAIGPGGSGAGGMSMALRQIIPLGLAFLAAALASGATAVAIERIAYRPLRRRGGSRLGYLITAIGMSILLQNLFLLLDGQPHLGLPFDWPAIAGRNAVAYPELFKSGALFSVVGVPVSGEQVLIVGVATIMLFFLDRLVRRSRVGQQIRAVAEDPETASLMGVNVERVIIMTFFIGGALAGVAGVLFGLYYGQAQFNMGFNPGIKAFTAAVLGGIGNVRGAMLGGLLLGVIENLGTACAGTQWQGVISFAILILVLTFRPNGLLGEEVRG